MRSPTSSTSKTVVRPAHARTPERSGAATALLVANTRAHTSMSAGTCFVVDTARRASPHALSPLAAEHQSLDVTLVLLPRPEQALAPGFVRRLKPKAECPKSDHLGPHDAAPRNTWEDRFGRVITMLLNSARTPPRSPDFSAVRPRSPQGTSIPPRRRSRAPRARTSPTARGRCPAVRPRGDQANAPGFSQRANLHPSVGCFQFRPKLGRSRTVILGTPSRRKKACRREPDG